MIAVVVRLDTTRITDWDSFHSVFAEAFGFPSFYGRNMNAWIDCMTDLDEPGTGMTTVHGALVTLVLSDAKAFRARCPEQYAAIVECSAFVNWRRLETGETSVLALAFG